MVGAHPCGRPCCPYYPNNKCNASAFYTSIAQRVNIGTFSCISNKNSTEMPYAYTCKVTGTFLIKKRCRKYENRKRAVCIKKCRRRARWHWPARSSAGWWWHLSLASARSAGWQPCTSLARQARQATRQHHLRIAAAVQAARVVVRAAASSINRAAAILAPTVRRTPQQAAERAFHRNLSLFKWLRDM
jgi:hypothetical protein